MFEVSAPGIEALIKKFDEWADQISGLKTEVPKQLEEWQLQDMRRRFPNQETETSDDGVTTSTEIWPRSRTSLEDEQRRRANIRALKGPKTARIIMRGPRTFRTKTRKPPGSGARPLHAMRPILRDELFVKLREREVDAMREAGKWPST